MLHASDLLSPKGRLNAATLWPGTSLNVVSADLEEYLTEAYVVKAADLTGADQDEAARQWAYYRAWDGVYQRLLVMPSSVSISDEGSSTITQGQIDLIGELAKMALAEFEVLIAASVGDTGAYGTIRSLR